MLDQGAEIKPRVSLRYRLGTAVVTESQTTGPDSHTDITLWYVLQGDRAVTLTPDPAEISDLRWVRLADVAQRAPQSPAAHQVLRFTAKLAATLDGWSAS